VLGVETKVCTVLDRILAAGISADRALSTLAAGVVRLDGAVVTDPEAPAPWPTRIVYLPA
jgi:hypothetical protein